MDRKEVKELIVAAFCAGLLVGIALIMLALVFIRNVAYAAEVTPTFVEITEGPESAVYVADTNDCPYSTEVPLSEELQGFLWERCGDVSEQQKELYVFMLGLIDAESEFTPTAYHKNGNGSTDRGLCQTNSCWLKDLKNGNLIESKEDLYDPYTSINCCLWELQHKLESYGITERLYYWYNTGSEKGSSNRNSRRMVGKWEKWKGVIHG